MHGKILQEISASNDKLFLFSHVKEKEKGKTLSLVLPSNANDIDCHLSDPFPCERKKNIKKDRIRFMVILAYG
jgi:hypothetical protein